MCPPYHGGSIHLASEADARRATCTSSGHGHIAHSIGWDRSMLPMSQRTEQMWLREEFLCEVEYNIGEPLKFAYNPQVQRIDLVVLEVHCAAQLDMYDLTLMLADGQRYHIPRPLQ